MKGIAGLVFFVALLLTDYSANAQDTLPAFTVVNRNGKVILSWVNNFPVIKQMSIQRSADSLKGFKTILTLPDPTSVTNGFLDNNAPDTVSFYKLYILLDSGKYLFSKSQRPQKPAPPVVKAAPAAANNAANANAENTTKSKEQTQSDNRSTPVTKNQPAEALVAANETSSKTYERESIKTNIKRRSDGLKTDTVTQMTKVEVYKPSSFIFTNSDGNVTIVLPAGKQNQFRIKFFDEDGSDLFQLNSIREQIVILDKSNFMHSGWFRFELYEKDVLKEKNKILIPRDPGMR
ncbi:MAG: hypothetical protein ACTHMM_09105 [Agriterribacter sp.]